MTGSDLHFALFAYACGSIPFGLLLTRAAGLGDVRAIGSGNIGATNVLRTGNKKIAALTLLLDAAKGLVPVLLAKHYAGPVAEIASGFAAMAGHVFPVWLRFRGGKGVATGLGILVGWSWMLALVALASWIVIFLVTRISSLSALLAVVVAAGASLISALGFSQFWWAVAILAAVIWVTHRANISRLLKGEESKSSFKTKG